MNDLTKGIQNHYQSLMLKLPVAYRLNPPINRD
jgi:hypothetical protein